MIKIYKKIYKIKIRSHREPMWYRRESVGKVFECERVLVLPTHLFALATKESFVFRTLEPVQVQSKSRFKIFNGYILSEDAEILDSLEIEIE